MTDEQLYDAFAVIAGALDTKTIEAVLNDLKDGGTGPEIKAARSAFANRKRARQRGQNKQS